VKPAPRKTFAYAVGIRNAKQIWGFGVGDVLGVGGGDGVGGAEPGDAEVEAEPEIIGDGGGGHFDDDDTSVSAPSRLPKTIGADSTDRIGAR
jgi:hypothetical protein